MRMSLEDAEEREAANHASPCQLCGKVYPARYLFDVKGTVPGGAKMTCLECVGRLDEREACAKAADNAIHCQCTDFCECYGRDSIRKIAAAIRARSVEA